MFGHIKHSQKIIEKFWYIYGQKLHKRMINSNANFYLKPNDIISHRPSLFGYHEPHIEKFISNISDGYSDFFLDLGANIGLTSALVGKKFSRVDCVEPNELTFNILKTNLALNLLSNNFECHLFGLGHRDEILNLKVPDNNFGGAYLESENKLVDIKEIELGGEQNFIETEVKIRKATSWLAEYFQSLDKIKLKKGVIKIDVEGYEEVVFRSVLSTLPNAFEAIVVMENWFDKFPISQYISNSHDIQWFYFKKKKKHFHSLLFKLLGLSSSYEHHIVELSEDTPNPHDIICVISGKK